MERMASFLRLILLAALLLILFLGINAEGNRYSQFLVGLIHKVRAEKNFESLVIYQTTNGRNCIEDEVLSTLEIPVEIISSEIQCSLQNSTSNHEILLVYCLEEDFVRSETDPFLSCLGRLRHTRIIFVWNTNEPKNSLETNSELFEFCRESFLPNAMSIYSDVWRTMHLYSYVQYPKFSLIKCPLSGRIFSKFLGNLRGADLRTLPDRTSPRCIVYFDENGMHVSGYVAKIVQEFAKKHNATLVFPYPLDSETVYNYIFMQDVIKNNSLDIPMSASSPVKHNNPQFFSRIVEQATWFPMIPVVEPPPVREIFLLIIDSRLTGILLLLWLGFSILLAFQNHCWSKQEASLQLNLLEFLQTLTEVFRGMLSQSITLLQKPVFLLKATYLMLFMSGIFLGTTYSAYFQTFLTNPPKSKQINSFDDLLRSSIRIHALEYELEAFRIYAGDKFWKKYHKVFQVGELKELSKARRALEIGKAYTVTSSLWVVFDQIQSRMLHPRFHHSPEMYFTKGLYLCIPQYEHSIYRNALNILILQLQESGILSYWQRNSMKDMVKAGEINLIRESVDTQPNGLSVYDFYWVWWIHLFGLSIGGLTFLLENFVDHAFNSDSQAL